MHCTDNVFKMDCFNQEHNSVAVTSYTSVYKMIIRMPWIKVSGNGLIL